MEMEPPSSSNSFTSVQGVANPSLTSSSSSSSIDMLDSGALAKHEFFMEHALKEAQDALDEGEIPVGCVFVSEASGLVVTRGHNKTNESRNVRSIINLYASRFLYFYKMS